MSLLEMLVGLSLATIVVVATTLWHQGWRERQVFHDDIRAARAVASRYHLINCDALSEDAITLTEMLESTGGISSIAQPDAWQFEFDSAYANYVQVLRDTPETWRQQILMEYGAVLEAGSTYRFALPLLTHAEHYGRLAASNRRLGVRCAAPS